MGIPLREPFFLRGRRSVLLRAIWMSLAISVIGGGAGLAAVLVYLLLGLTVGLEGGLLRLVGGSAAVSLATVVGIPYFRWRGDSVRGIAARAGCIMLIAAGPMLLENKLLWGLLAQAAQQLDAWKSDMEWGERLIVSAEFMFVLILLWVAWSAACVRSSRSWLLTILVSGLSIPLWILSLAVSMYSVGFAQNALPSNVFSIMLSVLQLSLPGQFFALLVIPWGAPFWWPPNTELPSQVELA